MKARLGWKLVAMLWLLAYAGAAGAAGAADAPSFTLAPSWPKPLPHKWALGPIGGVAVDRRGHIWISQFVGTPAKGSLAEKLMADMTPDMKAPPIIEFDQAGNVLRAWGGPGKGYDWPRGPHDLFVDHKGFVWIGGTWPNEDAEILKFTQDGRFVLQIGRTRESGGAASTDKLDRPANFTIDPKTNELYVADGYGNRRVMVFDADTGNFKRMWGAYGKPPADPRPDALDNYYHSDPVDPKGPPPERFNSPVHCAVVAKDGLVYVCDRTNARVQVFRTDGTFVREFPFDRGPDGTKGQITDVALWPDAKQTYLIAGGDEILVLRRSDGQLLSRSAGGPGELQYLHLMAMDPEGNLYTGEVMKRVQKWVPTSRPRR